MNFNSDTSRETKEYTQMYETPPSRRIFQTKSQASPLMEPMTFNNFLESRCIPQALTRERMLEYLANPDEFICELTMFYTKVAQKSYKNERRHICPPPCVYLRGGGWKRKQNEAKSLYADYLEQVGTQRTAQTELMSKMAGELCAWIGFESQERQLLDFSNGKDYCAAKQMHWPNVDNSKYIHMSVQLQYGSSQEIGMFQSSSIKVISKPPTHKALAVKDTECESLCICSGTKVAIYSRSNSGDRFLHNENDKFHASLTHWGAFDIYLYDEVGSLDSMKSQVTVKQGFITYGSIVKLVDSETGQALPLLRIKKIKTSKDTKPTIMPEIGEPVQQMHKCAFELLDDDGSYLGITQSLDNLEAVRQSLAQDRLSIKADELVIWSIITVDTQSFRFCEAMGPVARPVTPVPFQIEMELTGSEYLLKITGQNMTSSMTIWFAATAVDTVCRNEEELVGFVPPYCQILQDLRVKQLEAMEDDSLQIPICLVRDDGVIYSTELIFDYSVPSERIREIGNAAARRMQYMNSNQNY